MHVVDVLGAAGRDRPVAFEARIVDEEHVAGGSVELILGDAGLGAAHRFHHRQAGDLRCAPDHGDLAGALDAAQLVEDRVEVADLGPRLPGAQELDEPLLARHRAVPEIVDARRFCGHELAAALAEVLGWTEFRINRRRRGATAATSPLPAFPAPSVSGQPAVAIASTETTSSAPDTRFTSSTSSADRTRPSAASSR